MLKSFRIRQRNREIIDALYHGIVARSRTPRLFLDFGVPDTVMGRFEALSLHVYLALLRCRDDAAAKPVAQDLVDRFVADVEDSIREIGVGDVAVPKRMRRLAGRFYERVAAYDGPMLAGDVPGLAAALAERALADAPPERRDAAGLATYMMATQAELAAVTTDRILSGHLYSEEEAR
ncbi:ubiquinol-cytochrome c chaperone [Aureimonas endophytica]|uniref:Ubiquinol-cytochrome c chaperone n=1 Tax=Aureimonas endophytica TaxID=2027858 RepID=A0A916ZC74_9HYPH|nr:ubiquinol-cytochrome C chaperone family protein [Aureimonas endophytica]GGD86042.1 ubiquinol-cytochrome c chaperone [Aureimonas endophytica]